MYSHVMVGTSDLERSKAFYDRLLGTLGAGEPVRDRERYFYVTKEGIFAISKPIDGRDATVGNGSTVGFVCQSPEQVEAWHRAGVEAGGTPIEDPPGVREGGLGRLYLAYLRDPDGNKLCALHRMQ
jgi:catechol 2,3-dioxygenase-like lactoylglutathione lyase family enzyme